MTNVDEVRTSKRILKILAEYADGSSRVKNLTEEPFKLTAIPPDSKTTIQTHYFLPSNEFDGLEFSVIQQRLGLSFNALKEELLNFLKLGFVHIFRKSSRNDFLNRIFSQTTTPSSRTLTLTNWNSPQNYLVSITDEGRKNLKTILRQPNKQIQTEKIKNEVTKKYDVEEVYRIKFKDFKNVEKQSFFQYGEKIAPLPRYTIRARSRSIQGLVAKFLYTGTNLKKISCEWDEIEEFLTENGIGPVGGAKSEGWGEHKKIQKMIRDAIRAINKKTKECFGFKILKHSRGLIIKSK